MMQNEENQTWETNQTILLTFHKERASFWARCADRARTASSKIVRNANARKHFDYIDLLELELNDTKK